MKCCLKCGFQVDKVAQFCPACGNQFGVSAKKESSATEDYPLAEHKVQSGGTNYYCYPKSNMGYGAPTPSKKSSVPLIIALVAIVVLLIAVGFLIYPYFSTPHSTTEVSEEQTPEGIYSGYWEAVKVEVDLSDLFMQELIDSFDISSLVGLQIFEDGNVILIASFLDSSLNGTWEPTEAGIALTVIGQTLNFRHENDQLILEYEDGHISFEKIESERDDIPNFGNKTSESPNGSDTAGVFGSGDVDNGFFTVAVVGAESIKDVDGLDAIRIYFNIKNNSDANISLFAAAYYTAYQDGEKLHSTLMWEGDPRADNGNLRIRSGVTIQTCVQFLYNPDGGLVDFEVMGRVLEENGGLVQASFEPDKLPGAPQPFPMAEYPEPTWTLATESEGYLNSRDCYVAVISAEKVEDFDGYPAVRVYYEFTNNDIESTSMHDEVYIYTYQDGVSLIQTMDNYRSETDNALLTEIEQGETITASVVFRLRNETSAVEAEVEENYSFYAIGQTFTMQ